MQNDPRRRNELYERRSIGSYALDYAGHLKAAIEAVDPVALEKAHGLIVGAAVSARRIFAIGNGGSAAIADHLCCDWVKGTHHESHPTVDSTSLSSNIALYSAIANDFGFEKVFTTQLKFLGRSGDVLVAVSSSGNSPNITSAVEAAHEIGMSTIGLSGFSGGKLKDIAQVALHVPANNYGVVEDAHQALCHILAQFIAASRDAGQ
jgi:phosphoheptose isomerase